MKLVNISDDRKTVDEARPELWCVHMRRSGVEEDEDGVSEQGPGAEADEEHDHQAEDGVQVVPVLPVSQPDDGGTDQDHDAAKRIRHHMQEHSLDVHLSSTLHNTFIISMTVTMTTKDHHSQDVDQETHSSNYQDHLGVLNLLKHQKSITLTNQRSAFL